MRRVQDVYLDRRLYQPPASGVKSSTVPSFASRHCERGGGVVSNATQQLAQSKGRAGAVALQRAIRTAPTACPVRPPPQQPLTSSSLTSTSSLTATGVAADCGPARPVDRRAPSLPLRSALEDYFYYVSLLDEPTLCDEALAALHGVLARVRHARRCHRAGRPPRTRGEVSGAGAILRGSTPSPSTDALHDTQHTTAETTADEDESLLRGLTETALSTSLTHAIALLQSLFDQYTSSRASSPVFTLLVGALAELRWRHFLATPPLNASAELLTLLDMAVQRGHVGAMLAVGICLREGYGATPADLGAALVWIEQAARRGYVPAMYELAELYERGAASATDVIDPDWAEAARWYGRAAQKASYVPAQLNLGKLLLLAAETETGGTGAVAAEARVLRERGEEWVERAAAGGSEEAIRLRQHFARQRGTS